mgnify:CR=1 FL=1
MHHLKQYFAAHKKHGSTDRRTIEHLCYTYYRLGAIITNFDTDKGLQLAIFLCEAKPANWALLFEPSWLAVWNSSDVSSDVSLEQKLDFIKEVYPGYNPASIFPFAAHLSTGVDASAFNRSHLIQPDLFIRTGGEQRVSNFLLWQLAYTELYFTDTLWPDFDATQLQAAFAWYAQRERRFGRTSAQLADESNTLPLSDAV